jgi:hypothetical protein
MIKTNKKQCKMKKVYLLILIFCLPVICMKAQYLWAKAEGLYAYDYGYGMGTDNSGNLYVAGKFEQNANFSGTIFNCQGNHDIYLVKYASDGTLLWSRTAGGPNGDYAHNMYCDRSNYTYVAGEIEGYGDQIIFSNSSTTLNTVGDNDIFVAKYDFNGTLLWAKGDGWLRSEKALGVCADATGNVYICGYFTDTTSMGGVMHPGMGGEDIFLSKYDSNGNLLWTRYAGGSGRDEGKSIRCDASGNIYMCGLTQNGSVFGGITFTCSGQYYEAFLAKYAPDGSVQWVQRGGGDYDDVAWALTIDNNGKIFVGGEFNAYATFGQVGLTTDGRANVFVASYDASGNVLWAKSAGGTLDDRARGIGTDGNNIYITGQFGSNAAFGSYNVSAADSSDIFIAAMSNDGNFMWATAVGGAPDAPESLGYESGNAVCAENSGIVYATGALLNGGSFGGINVTGYARTDVFVTKLSSAALLVPELKLNEIVNVYPNPSTGNILINAGNYEFKKMNVSVYDDLGRVVTSQMHSGVSSASVDLSGMASGIYFLELKTDNNSTLRKKIVLKN